MASEVRIKRRAEEREAKKFRRKHTKKVTQENLRDTIAAMHDNTMYFLERPDGVTRGLLGLQWKQFQSGLDARRAVAATGAASAPEPELRSPTPAGQ